MSVLKWLPRSLRYRLIVLLLAALAFAAVLQGVSAYSNALAETDKIFDYHMQQMAFSLRGNLGAALGSGTVRLPIGEDQSVDFFVQVWGLDGSPLYHPPGDEWLPEHAVLGFSEVDSHGHRLRVFSIQTRYQVVQIAQDLAVRHRMAGALALRTVMPIAWMLPALALLVWWVVSESVRPVERVRRQLAGRAAQDLSPVAEAELPAEVQPLVREFNLLLTRMQHAFDAQQRFVADAAHELRSPLTALKLQVLGLQRATDESLRATAQQRLASGIDRASHLVEQLLLLARQQGAPTAQQTVALAPLLRQALFEQLSSAEARGIELSLMQADEVSVSGQIEALPVLMRNLLENAIKYTPEGGKVQASLRASESSTSIVVEDSGPGIAPDERERVFDRFYRSPDSATAALGSGLGLAIVKSIAQAHGAQITLDSSDTLGGLRVVLSFPI